MTTTNNRTILGFSVGGSFGALGWDTGYEIEDNDMGMDQDRFGFSLDYSTEAGRAYIYYEDLQPDMGRRCELPAARLFALGGFWCHGHRGVPDARQRFGSEPLGRGPQGRLLIGILTSFLIEKTISGRPSGRPFSFREQPAPPGSQYRLRRSSPLRTDGPPDTTIAAPRFDAPRFGQMWFRNVSCSARIASRSVRASVRMA